MRMFFTNKTAGQTLTITRKDLKKFTAQELRHYVSYQMRKKVKSLYGDIRNAELMKMVNAGIIPEYYWTVQEYEKEDLLGLIYLELDFPYYTIKTDNTPCLKENELFIESKTTAKRFFNADGSFKF